MKECPACRRCFRDDVNHCPNDGDATTPSITGEPLLDGRFQLERRLGQGGMGIVFQARHIFLKTAHAIKIILPDLIGNDPMLITRFRQEAMAAAIHHQNIIAVTDFGVVRGNMPYLVMEFVKGRSLHNLLVQEKVLSPERALEIMTPICAGMSAAHRQNIVHRDLKPLNIMLQDGMPVAVGLKILDFGLAKIKSGELLGSFVQAKTSGLMGSPFYMAPEQWSDEEPDTRADIYSLGVILYQMLGGDLPFKGTSIPSIMKKHLTQPPPLFKSLGVNVPPVIEEVVRRALEKAADKRPQTIEDFISQLSDATAQVKAGRYGLHIFVAGDSTEEETIPHVLHGQHGRFSDSASAEPTSPQQEGVSLAETQQGLEEEVERLARKLAEVQLLAEEARLRREEAERKRAEEEAARKRAEEEAERKRAEEEAVRLRAEEEARLRAEEEAAQKRAEEEASLQRALEAARKRAEDEKARKLAEEEAIRLAQEVEEVKRRAEDARKQAKEEALRRAEEESARKLAEAKAQELERKFEEAQRRAEESRVRAEEEARINDEKEAARQRLEEENARQRAEEAARKRAEEEAARKQAEEESNRLAREIAEAQRSAEEARRRAEEEALKRAEEEAARKQAEEEARRLMLEVEEAKRRAEEVRRQAEEEAYRKALEEAERQRLEESLRKAESEHQQDEPEETRPLEALEPPRDEAARDFQPGQTNVTQSLEDATGLTSTLYTPQHVPLNAGVASQLQSQDRGLGEFSGDDQSGERFVSARAVCVWAGRRPLWASGSAP